MNIRPGKGKKIAIVGCYPETWEQAPFNDPEWEIWGFSRRNWKNLPRCDKWFELHTPRKFPSYEIDFPGYCAFLESPHCVLAENFPKDALIERFGSFFFSGGQAPWMMAYAITQEPEAIGLWGIECVDRYAFQRFEVQHFLLVAHDRGIKLVIPENCTLMEPRKLYT